MSNPFLKASMEENTLDANDNNPLLKAEDPAKTAEEDGAKIANEFEYVESEAVEGENQKPDDAVLVDAVKDTTTEVNNIVAENKTTTDTLDAVASVAQEMYAVIQERGKLLPVEMMTIQGHMASLESRAPWVGGGDVQMPSLESFKVVGLQYTTSQVAMEGVLSSINAGLDKMMGGIALLIKNGIGLATAGLKLAGSRKAEATKLLSSLDGSHREAGLKEVGGSFVEKLVVDGRAPDAATVLKTAVYTNACLGELLSFSATKAAGEHVRQGVKALYDSLSVGKMDKPSGWLTFWVFFAFGNSVIPVVKVVHDQYKVRKQIRVDPAASPQLFKLYPNTAKVASNEGSSPILDTKRSLPLFGNRAIQIEQYADVVDREKIRKDNVPNVKLVTMGGSASAGKMQALSGAQQKDVLNSAIEMLSASEGYYRDYATRNNEFYTTYKSAINTGLKFKEESGSKKSYTLFLASSLASWYSKVFWNGIFANQANIAKYGIKTAGALIDLVSASSAVAKANVAGSASQESLPVAEEPSNPFM